MVQRYGMSVMLMARNQMWQRCFSRWDGADLHKESRYQADIFLQVHSRYGYSRSHQQLEMPDPRNRSQPSPVLHTYYWYQKLYIQYSFLPRTIQQWNRLPAAVAASLSLDAFKEGICSPHTLNYQTPLLTFYFSCCTTNMHTLLFSLLSLAILLFLSHLYIHSARTNHEPVNSFLQKGMAHT